MFEIIKSAVLPFIIEYGRELAITAIALLVRKLEKGRLEKKNAELEDKIHQQYRGN